MAKPSLPAWLCTLPWPLLPLRPQWFVVGHDCGHRSFSKNKLVEDIVGTIMFMPLIYPFEPWRIKHNVHHAHTNKCVLLRLPCKGVPLNGLAASAARAAGTSQPAALPQLARSCRVVRAPQFGGHIALVLSIPLARCCTQAGGGHSLAPCGAREDGEVEPRGVCHLQAVPGHPAEAVCLHRPLVDLAL